MLNESAQLAPSSLSPVPLAEVDLQVDQLRPSETASQKKRRSQYNSSALKALAVSIAQRQLQAIVVRPLPTLEERPLYEIVAGERRWIASKLAGLPTIRAKVWALTDAEALAAQLEENLGREDVHPLAEAEGYDELIQDHGLSVQEVGLRFNKSSRHVAERLRLLKLCAPVRQAFEKGTLSEGAATLIARIPEESLQREALKRSLEGYEGEPMSLTALRREIQDSFMLSLKQAPFDTADATLIPGAGACGLCPKRTGNQPELFSDVKGKDVCTDPKCFKTKREAHWSRRLQVAKDTNQPVIEGAAAKKIAPHDNVHLLEKGYVSLDKVCHQHPKHQTYRQILGRDAPNVTLLQMPGSKELVEIVLKEEIAPILTKHGVKPFSSASDNAAQSQQDKARQDRAKRENKFRDRLFGELRSRYPDKIDNAILTMIGNEVFSLIPWEHKKRLLRTLGWQPTRTVDYQIAARIVREKLAGLTSIQLHHFLLDCILIRDVHIGSWYSGTPTLLLAFGKLVKVNAAAIRKSVDKEARVSARSAKKLVATPTRTLTQARSNKTPKRKRACHTSQGAASRF